MSAADGIGGYLELERFCGEPYHKDAVALNCGRGALAYEIELRGIHRVWLPDFMCDSVPSLFAREGVEIRTYTIGEDLLPEYGFGIASGEWMLLCDYYGQLRQEGVSQALEASGGRLVVDETQGFFRRPWEGADTCYSCRKWFGVSDGGYLATSDGAQLARELTRDESHARMAHVLGRAERPSSEFYADASANNESFADEPARLMSPITEDLLRGVDYEAVRQARLANWDRLDAVLGDSNQLALRRPEGPFMYPYLVDDTDGVRQRMAAEGVFVPTLWPNVLDDCLPDTIAYRYAKNILPLPIDQRYGAEEMDKVLEVLGKCLG